MIKVKFKPCFQNFPSDYTVSDTYDVMKIIKETYGDADFNNIYLLGFESTSIDGKASQFFIDSD